MVDFFATTNINSLCLLLLFLFSYGSGDHAAHASKAKYWGETTERRLETVKYFQETSRNFTTIEKYSWETH